MNGRCPGVHSCYHIASVSCNHIASVSCYHIASVYGVPFSHLFTELQISPIEVHI